MLLVIRKILNGLLVEVLENLKLALLEGQFHERTFFKDSFIDFMETAKSFKFHYDVWRFVVFQEQKGLDEEVLTMAELEVSNEFLNFLGRKSLSDNLKSIEVFSDFVAFPGFLDFDGCADIDQMSAKNKGKGV